MNIAELARRTGIPRPTVYRVMEILESESYICKTGGGGLYQATLPENRVDDGDNVHVRSFHPIMKRIAEKTGHAVFLSKAVGDDVLVLHREIGTYPIQILSLPIGGRQPLGVGATGIAILSAFPSRGLTAVLNRNREAYKSYGNLTDTVVRRLVENCQLRGYAVVGNYALKGVLALGMLFDSDSLGKCAMSVTAPIERLGLQAQREAAHLMRAELGLGQKI